VAEREYVVRQIATLLQFAKTTTDPNVSAALIEKAADIKDRHDPPPDRSPRAPDVEPPTSNFYDPGEHARPEIAAWWFVLKSR
jgi:hypothetical protein